MKEIYMKKFGRTALIIMVVFVLAATLAGCGGKSKKADEDAYRIGVLQYTDRKELNEAAKGFREGVESVLGEDKVVFDVQDGQGKDANMATIANLFVTDKVDLIMADATPALKACADATQDIPVVGTSVTDYASALDIKDWTGTTGRNVTGTSDLAPVDEQVNMIKEIKPDLECVGIIYSAKESNSRYQVDEMAKVLDSQKIRYRKYRVALSSDIQKAVDDACENCDVIYIPTDNMMASNADTVRETVISKKIPVVAGSREICEACGAVTLSVNYHDIGYRAGEMAGEILKDKKSAGDMPVEMAEAAAKLYNEDITEKIGLTVPSGYEPIATE